MLTAVFLMNAAPNNQAQTNQAQTGRPTNALNQVVPTAAHLEPAISRPAQDAEAKRKLEALEKKFGRKPNVLILLVDDLGYGDVGVYGGGEMVGSPTPNIDRLAWMLSAAGYKPALSGKWHLGNGGVFALGGSFTAG